MCMLAYALGGKEVVCIFRKLHVYIHPLLVVEALDKEREPLTHLEAIYLMLPTEEVCV